ncbi:MAG: glycosyltransferase family 4 protein [Armatimonadetes bacterium]|nr:glycosyltransferase family 4 protein [Armatimonadota bacterium]
MVSETPGLTTIAYADHAVEKGGAEVSLLLLLKRLDRSAFRPVLLHAPDAEWLADLTQAQVELVAIFKDSSLLRLRRGDVAGGLWRNLSRIARASGALWDISRAIRGTRARLLHSNTLKCHLLAGAAARLAGARVIWHMRDIVTEPAALNLLRWAGRVVRPHIIAISQAVARSVQHLGCPVEVVYNGVPLDAFKPGPPNPALVAELSIEPHHRVLMTVARLTPWKGHQELLRAMPAILSRFPDARLLVVGGPKFWDESYAEELRRLAQHLGVNHAVRWLGHRNDVAELLRLCEVFVLPSRDEPFGRALVEAMATAKPVVAGSSGAAPEVCPDGECGLLVDPADPGEIAQAVIELLANPEHAQALGLRGRERAAQLFDVTATTKRIEDIYRRLLDR